MENILPDCRMNDLELFCFQRQLGKNLSTLYRAVNTATGVAPSRDQWIRNQLNHVPDSEAKDYICINYIQVYLGGGRRCSELP